MRTIRKIEEDAPPGVIASGDVRCGCGSLLARFVDGVVELKCRRCKQVWRLPVEGSPAASGGAFAPPGDAARGRERRGGARP